MYKDVGWCVEVATHPYFRALTLAVVLFSVLWIAVETNYVKSEDLFGTPFVFSVVDMVLCAFFSFEVAVRIGAIQRKRVILRGPFLMLDISLVFITAWETWVQVLCNIYKGRAHEHGSVQWLSLRVIRMARVLRVARSRRFTEIMPELMTFVDGMKFGLRAVATSMLMLMCVIYVFGIAFTQLLGDTETGKGCFETVLTSMHFLFITALCSIDKNFILKMLDAGWLYWFLWLSFLLIANLTIMRMLTGVIMNQTNAVNANWKDQSKKLAMEQQLLDVLSQLDADNNGVVSESEFRVLFQNTGLLEQLSNLEVDIHTFLEETLRNWPNGDVFISYIVEKAFAYRGSNTATFKDILETRRFIEMTHKHLEGTLPCARTPARSPAESEQQDPLRRRM